jgi:hypothetical protein
MVAWYSGIIHQLVEFGIALVLSLVLYRYWLPRVPDGILDNQDEEESM